MSDLSNFNMPKAYAQKLLNEELEMDPKIKTVFNTNYKDSLSYNQKVKLALAQFEKDISPALKRMKQGYFEQTQEKCYDPKHISDTFTNVEQINLCKQEQYDEVFGAYQQMVKNHRESDTIRFENC